MISRNTDRCTPGKRNFTDYVKFLFVKIFLSIKLQYIAVTAKNKDKNKNAKLQKQKKKQTAKNRKKRFPFWLSRG